MIIVKTPMENQIVKIIEKDVNGSLLKYFRDISEVGNELGINMKQLWNAYLRKLEYNQLDRREKRHITQQSKIDQSVQDNLEGKKKVLFKYYGINNEKRELNKDTKYPVVIFYTEDDIRKLSNIIPPYIKFEILKCSDIYFVDIPLIAIKEFPKLPILLFPHKKTVIIGIEGYSPDVDLEMYKYNNILNVGFINNDIHGVELTEGGAKRGKK